MLMSVMHIRTVCVGMLNRFVRVDVGIGHVVIGAPNATANAAPIKGASEK
jgi:hypothetical protein